MKQYLIAILIIFLVASGIFTGCSATSSVAGLYESQGNPGYYINLNSDGTWVRPMGFHGEWQVDGNELTLISVFGLEKWRIEGNKLIDPTGSVYVKR